MRQHLNKCKIHKLTDKVADKLTDTLYDIV